MRNDIKLAKITTKQRFENANFKFYHELNPKAAEMMNTHVKTTRRQQRLRKSQANEAWWSILSM